MFDQELQTVGQRTSNTHSECQVGMAQCWSLGLALNSMAVSITSRKVLINDIQVP